MNDNFSLTFFVWFFRPKRFNSRVRMDGLGSETTITETVKQWTNMNCRVFGGYNFDYLYIQSFKNIDNCY